MLKSNMEQLADARGDYLTPSKNPSPVARAFPSLHFYANFLGEVLRRSSMARQGKLDAEAWYQGSLAVLHALERTGVHIQIEGMNAIKQAAGPVVFIANHMSTLETIVLPGMLQPLKDVTFVVKRGIVEYPIFKHIMLTRDPIVVDRVNPREDLAVVLESGCRLLGQGRSLVVFPQTTRTLTFDTEKFNSIGIKLARNANVPVVPVAVKSDAWGIGHVVKEIGKIDPSKPVRFAFGAPLAVEGRGNATHQAVIAFIRHHLEAWGVATA